MDVLSNMAYNSENLLVWSKDNARRELIIMVTR